MRIALFIFGFFVLMSFRNGSKNISAEKNIFVRDTAIDFQDEVSDKIPTGFSQQNNNCNQSVNWVVLNDKTNRIVTQRNKNTGDCINIITTNLSCKNLTLTAHVKSVSGDKVQGGGLIWRYIDKNNYYMAGISPLDNSFRFYKRVKGNQTELKYTPCDVKIGIWCTLSIEMNKNHILCWLNGEKVGDLDDESIKTAGKIGFWTKADAETHFDELFVLPEKRKLH